MNGTDKLLGADMQLDNSWLIGLQRAQFDKSGQWRNISIVSQVAAIIVSIASVFINHEKTLYGLAIVAILLMLLSYWALHKQRESRALAECARRASMLMGGLGDNLPPEILKEIWADATVSEDAVKARKDVSYYQSNANAGNKRLYEIMYQSMFWTAYLQKKSSEILWPIFFLLIIVVIVILLVAGVYAEQESVISIGRVVLVAVSALVTQGLFGAAMSHHQTAVGSKKLLNRMIEIKAKNYHQAGLLHALMEYNSLVERAPLTFPGVYSRYRDRLNEHWKSEENQS